MRQSKYGPVVVDSPEGSVFGVGKGAFADELSSNRNITTGLVCRTDSLFQNEISVHLRYESSGLTFKVE